MTTLNKQQIDTIIKNAPPGTDKVKLLDGLITRGYEIEGVDTNLAKADIAKRNGVVAEVPKKTFGQKVGAFAKDAVDDFKQVGNDIMNASQKSADIISNADRQITPPESAVIDPTKKLAPKKGDLGSMFQAVGALANAGAESIGAAFKGALKIVLPQEAEDKIKELAAKGITNAMSGEYDGGVIKSVTEKAKELYANLSPEQQKNVDAVGGIANLVTQFIGAGTAENLAAKQVIKQGEKMAVKETGSIIAKNAAELAGEGRAIIANAKTAVQAQPAKIMQRVARIPKGRQAAFEATAKESVGDYLVNRGIYGNVDEISTQLYKRFEQSKNTADTALEKLTGTFEPEQVKTALSELAEREARVSAPGAPSPNLARVAELQSKIGKEGLTMTEINEVKRLYERNVKLDFVKANLPESVARANNIDDAIRTWQFDQAETLGLKNLPEINRETRLAKQLLDDLGKEYSGAAGNNAMTLTDWIMLSGGDPTAVGGFLTKKTFSSKSVQSAIAKALAKDKPIKGAVEADIGTSQVKQLPAGRTDVPPVQNNVAPKLPTQRMPDEKGVTNSSKLQSRRSLGKSKLAYKETVPQAEKITTTKLPAEVKSNIVEIIDDFRLNKGVSKTLQEDAARIAEDLGIKMPKTYAALVNKLEKILQAADAKKIKVVTK
jgi:hypothetical protein